MPKKFFYIEWTGLQIKCQYFLFVKDHISLLQIYKHHFLIRLDNFEGGYCGVSKIEDDQYCLCYLSETANLKKYSGIPEMEEQVLFRNPN